MRLNLPVKVSRNGQELGVFPIEEIAPRLNCWFFEPTDLYWHEGMSDWEPLAQFKDEIVRSYFEYHKLSVTIGDLKLVRKNLLAQLQGVESEIKQIEVKLAVNKAKRFLV
jgi:hypothetical protein